MFSENLIGWVDAEVEQPEEMTTVMVYTAGGSITFGTFHEGAWQVDLRPWELSGEEWIDIGVVCWRSLPQPGIAS